VNEDARRPTPGLVLALDPGSDKCGLALVASDGRILARAVTSLEQAVELVRAWLTPQAQLVLGRGTGYRRLLALLRGAGLQPQLVDERGSTLEARRLYWQENPPRGWRRFVPRGLLVPPVPLDDWAAAVLARRFLGLPPA
jgi:hypothetical protein